jgi:hypothetical protein
VGGKVVVSVENGSEWRFNKMIRWMEAEVWRARLRACMCV